ncbi:MAG: hypothetical protein AAF367_03495 [Pseudomonadota bacterium]
MIRTISLLAALALTACTGGAGTNFADNVTRDLIYPNYEPISVSVFAGGGGNAVIVGTTRDGASAEEIAANIRLPAFVAPRTIRAATEAQTGPHLVLVFAPQGRTTPRRACSGQAQGGQAGDTLVVLGVFCSSFGTPVSEGLFTASGSPVPSDPDFRQRLSVLMNNIMPVRNPDFQGEPRIGG